MGKFIEITWLAKLLSSLPRLISARREERKSLNKKYLTCFQCFRTSGNAGAPTGKCDLSTASCASKLYSAKKWENMANNQAGISSQFPRTRAFSNILRHAMSLGRHRNNSLNLLCANGDLLTKRSKSQKSFRLWNRS